MSIEKDAYEIVDLWVEENIRPSDMARVKFIASLIPSDVDVILDIGCGGGIFLNYLVEQKKYKSLLGVDRSFTAIKFVKTEKCVADIVSLPFAESEFDLVVCLEVIEHLPLPKYTKGLSEICRVAHKYIIITVPNNENLERSLVRCPYCHTRFNPDYHMRSYQFDSLDNLLNPYKFRCVKKFRICGGKEYVGIQSLKKVIGFYKIPTSNYSMIPWFAICPVCGYHGSLKAPGSNAHESKSRNLCYHIMKHFWPKRRVYYWIGGLYVKD